MPPGMNVGPDCLGWLGSRQGQAAQAGWAEPGGQSKLVWQPGLAGHQESACSGGPFRGPWASLGPLGRPWNPLDVLGDQFGASWGPIWAPLEPPWASLLAQNAIYANAILYVTFPALILGVHGSPWACRGSFLSFYTPMPGGAQGPRGRLPLEALVPHMSQKAMGSASQTKFNSRF